MVSWVGSIWNSLAVETMESIDFQNFLLKGILGFLLFAGGLGINLKALRSQKWEITILSIAATLLSTFIIGYGFWFIAKLLGWELPLVSACCSVPSISPTDPIAVLAIVKKMKAPPESPSRSRESPCSTTGSAW